MAVGNYGTLKARKGPTNKYGENKVKHYACDRVNCKRYVKEKDEINMELKADLEYLRNLIEKYKIMLEKRKGEKVTTIETIRVIVKTDSFKNKFPKCAEYPECVQMVWYMYDKVIRPQQKEENDVGEKAYDE